MFIRQMTYLVALDREKHFGRAADVCNATQSTLSAGLKSLERELDMRLVVRGSRFIGLTPEGERVVDWASQILADYESLKQDVEMFRGGLQGTLRLGVIPAALPSVATLTAPFAAKHPQVAIDIQSMTSIEIQRGLDKFEIDAGMTYLENEPLAHVRKMALYRERYLFVTNRACSWAGSASITWRDAAKEKLCLLNENMQNRRVLNNVVRAIGCELTPSVTANSFLAICSHVCSGAWSSIIPHTFAYIFAGCEDLALIDLVEPVHSQTVGLVVSGRNPLPPLARTLMSCASRLNLGAVIGGETLPPP
ncbi:MAG: LysR family transcriptional regulator [Acidiphilium sp.]|nr:LysR family transcriptional regulator [Acidiphilium sp.]MDD4936119.1 LysR family transcriptional regulator [Acidiphilium sp.]